jgi:HSP20 family protein
VDLKPWNPWERFEQIQREINQTLDEFCRQLQSEARSRKIGFIPAIDLWETDSDLVVVVELPGVLEEDVDVLVTSGGLTIRGVRMEVPRGRAHLREWRWGEFERDVRFPADVDPESMRASYSEGTLEIHIRKRRGS